MATKFEGTMRIPADPAKAFAMLSDVDYVIWKHENMAAFDISAEVTTKGTDTVISSDRKLPAKIPAAARSLVGDAIEVNEVHTWGPAKADGSRTAKVVATFGSAPMSVSGTMALSPDGKGSIVVVDVDAKSSIPMIGSKLEAVAGEQFLRALAKEEKIAPEWLAKA